MQMVRRLKVEKRKKQAGVEEKGPRFTGETTPPTSTGVGTVRPGMNASMLKVRLRSADHPLGGRRRGGGGAGIIPARGISRPGAP